MLTSPSVNAKLPAAEPYEVDDRQLELAVELLTDVVQYVQNTIADDDLHNGQPLGDLVESVLGPNYIPKRRRSSAEALVQWHELEEFLESRLHKT